MDVKLRGRTAVLWLCLYSLLFGVAYAQKALFADNQNTKFISGLGHLGYGDVAADWMAGITDPFPLFSAMLTWQCKLLGLPLGVHLAFLMLSAAYGLIGVCLASNFLAGVRDRHRMLLVFAVIWLLAHTMHVRDLWQEWLPAGLAGQYLLGSYYQPCSFGILFLAGIVAYASTRLKLAALCFAAAALIHPTYVISSLVLAAAIIVLPSNRSLNISWSRRCRFLLYVLVIVVPYAWWFYHFVSSGDPVVQAQAHQLLAEVRIPHHAVPSHWMLGPTIGFFVVGVVAAWCGRQCLVGQLLGVLLLIVSVITLGTMVDSNATLAVLTPWRISTIAAPLSWVLLLGMVAKWIATRIQWAPVTSVWSLQNTAAIAVALACAIGIGGMVSSYERKKSRKYYSISRFLRQYHARENLYVIPVEEKHIRLEAGIPVLATWKSHPTKDSEFLEWHRRIAAAQRIYDVPESQLREEISKLQETYSVTHFVVPTSKELDAWQQVGERVYRDSFYSLWDVRRPHRAVSPPPDSFATEMTVAPPDICGQ